VPLRQHAFHRAVTTSRVMHAVIGLSALAGIVLLTLCASILWESREDAREQAHAAAQNLETLIQKDIGRTFDLYDLSLQGALEALKDPDFEKVGPAAQQLMLFDKAATATYLKAILVIDENGDLVRDARNRPATAIKFADRDYFRIHLDQPDHGPYVSEPFEGRLTGGWTMAISRRINKPDGSFGGIVMGALSLEYFNNLFSQLTLGPNASITLFRSSGTMLMRQPFRLVEIGRNFHSSDLFQHFPAKRSGGFEAVSTIDGVQRTYTFTQIGNLPLIVSIGLASEDIYANWRRKASLLVSFMVALALIVITLALLLSQELTRRRAVENRLAEAVGRDELTGVANRRGLDARLNKEWARIKRSGDTLCLLMIDVDFFKAYNDTFGHVLGDEALKHVAQCICTCVHRKSDFAARYGGEEFSVLLPHTGLLDAYDVAENIRAAVETCFIVHPKSPYMRVTVSIGVAELSDAHTEPSALVESADAALYEAKARGRNRTFRFQKEASQQPFVAAGTASAYREV
jgi:diguanylate cyclase (GGDEF)-like protein